MREAFFVAGEALHAHDDPLVELLQVRRAGVRARRTDPGDDLVEDVLDTRALRDRRTSATC